MNAGPKGNPKERPLQTQQSALSDNSNPPEQPGTVRLLLFLCAGILTFSFSPILVRFAPDTDAITLASLRTILAVLFLFPFWVRSRVPMIVLKDRGVRPSWLILAGVCLGIHFSLWIASVQFTSVASASVLVTIHPVILIVFERYLFHRRFSGWVWAGVLTALMGSVLLGLTDHTNNETFPNALLGNSFAVGAALIFAVYFLLGRKARQQTAWIDYVFIVYATAALVTTVVTLFLSGGIPDMSRQALLVGVLLAVGPTILGHGSMNFAVKYVSPTLLSTLILSEAVFAAGIAFVLFDEIPSGGSFLAMVIIFAGIALTWSGRGRQTDQVKSPENSKE